MTMTMTMTNRILLCPYPNQCSNTLVETPFKETNIDPNLGDTPIDKHLFTKNTLILYKLQRVLGVIMNCSISMVSLPCSSTSIALPVCSIKSIASSIATMI